MQLTYTPNEYENTTLNWFSKHLAELVSAAILAFLVWDAKMMWMINDKVTVNTTNIVHISKAVNNVKPGDPTLVESVDQLKVDVGILMDRTKVP